MVEVSPKFKSIAISGPIGSGTTTLGRLLAKELGWQFFEGGAIFAGIHKELGIAEEEVVKRPDHIDREFDKKMRDMFENGEKQIIEGHLAGLNARGLGHVFKIRLLCEENGEDKKEVRIDRVSRRDGLTMEQAKERVLEREGENIEKYQRVYGVNPYSDDSLYNLTINTFRHNKEETLAIALNALMKV